MIPCFAAVAKPVEEARLEKIMEDARCLMREGKKSQAFELLSGVERTYSGNKKFDYLYGIAAVDSGHPILAAIVLERLLCRSPEFAGARIDLARAYFDLKDYDAARREFRRALKDNPPPFARRTIENYLALIAADEERNKTIWHGYFDALVGYDSNINSSTEDDRVFVPALTVTVLLDSKNVEREDSYGGIGGGAHLEHGIGGQVSAYLDLSGKARFHPNENDFSSGWVDAKAGLEIGASADQLRVGVSSGRYWFDGVINRDRIGGDMEWRHRVDPNDLFSLYTQFNQYWVPDIEVNDFTQWVGGVSWFHHFHEIPNTLLHGSGYSGYEWNTERADGEKSLWGVRAGLQTELFPSLNAFAGIGGQQGRYRKANEAFLKIREDFLVDAAIGVNWTATAHVMVRPLLTYVHNDSSIGIYGYDRTDISVNIRYLFL